MVEEFTGETELVELLNKVEISENAPPELNRIPVVLSHAFEHICRQFFHSSNCNAISLYYEATLTASWISVRFPFFDSLAQNLLLVRSVCNREDRCVHMEMCLAECMAEIMIILPNVKGPSQLGEKEKILKTFADAVSQLDSEKEKNEGLLRQAILRYRLAKFLSPMDDRFDLLKDLKTSLKGVAFEKESTLRFKRMARDLRWIVSAMEFHGIIGQDDIECWMKNLWKEEKKE